MIAFENTYAALPDRFFARTDPVPVHEPVLIALNDKLALEMGLDPDWLRSPDGVAMLAGNRMPEGAAPIAQCLCGASVRWLFTAAW